MHFLWASVGWTYWIFNIQYFSNSFEHLHFYLKHVYCISTEVNASIEIILTFIRSLIHIHLHCIHIHSLSLLSKKIMENSRAPHKIAHFFIPKSFWFLHKSLANPPNSPILWICLVVKRINSKANSEMYWGWK